MALRYLHTQFRENSGAWRQPPLMGLMATEAVHNDDTRITASSTDSSGSAGSGSSANITAIFQLLVTVMDVVFVAAIIDSCSSPLRACDKTAAWVKDSVSEQERCRQRLLLLRKREGLLDITIRTVALMRHNKRLQLQLSALQEETRAFVRSVLDNPENQRSPDNSEEDVMMQDPAVSESSDSTAEK
ncbi:hypothetical protein PR048_009933 [Dryococelus australis]|uniref:Uncharacterized protein n=1 Tax=Dryococelus australis TaxID=614101 RepID=A0ABQ9I2C8_9NEOP|nr:hypothetical protein PR048_009933 [Dryococelus australis]